MKLIIYAILAWAVALTAHADVYVSDTLPLPIPSERMTAAAGSQAVSVVWSGGPHDADVQLTVRGDQRILDGASVFLCDENQLDLHTSGIKTACRIIGSGVGSNVTFKASADQPVFIVLDNQASLLRSRTIEFSGTAVIALPEEDRTFMKTGLKDGLKDMYLYFEIEDFDLHVASCGMNNAFSRIDTGDVTMCWELIFDTIEKSLPHASTGILMHEFGHTFLNLWGSPHFANEQTADEFAVAVLFISENFPTVYAEENPDFPTATPEEVVRELIAYFESIADLPSEIQAAYLGGPHPLSVQRMNNLKSVLASPSEFVTRWTTEIYPHLKPAALASIISNPHTGADVELAKSILAEKINPK